MAATSTATPMIVAGDVTADWLRDHDTELSSSARHFEYIAGNLARETAQARIADLANADGRLFITLAAQAITMSDLAIAMPFGNFAHDHAVRDFAAENARHRPHADCARHNLNNQACRRAALDAGRQPRPLPSCTCRTQEGPR